MARLVGIRERVHSMGLLSRDVQGMGQFPLTDAALRDVSLRAFEHVWPVMEVHIDEKLKRERYVTLAMGGLAVASYIGLLALLGVKLPWRRKYT